MEKEIKHIENQLDLIKKGDHLSLPNDFFNQMKKEILSKTVEKERKHESLNLSYIAGIAACTLFIILSTIFDNQPSRSEFKNQFISKNETQDELLEDYLLDEFTYEELSASIESEDEFLEELFTENLENLNSEDNDEAVIDYLIAEDIDIYEILEMNEDYAKLLCIEC